MFGRNHGRAVWPVQEDPPSPHQAGSWRQGRGGARARLTAVREASPATEAACPIPLLPEQEGLMPDRTKARSLSTYLRRSTNPATARTGSGWLCDLGQAHSLL